MGSQCYVQALRRAVLSLVVMSLLSQIASPLISASGSVDEKAYGWWDTSWKYRRQISITENAGNTVTNYPIVITLNQTHFQQISPSGNDIRFIANGTELEYDIKQWDYNTTATLWVKYNLTAFGTSTLHMYYGNEQADSRQGQISTTVVGNTSYDASSYENDGMIYGATSTFGALFNGLSFDGEDDYIEVLSSASLNLSTQITLEAWIKPKDVSGYHDIISKWELDATPLPNRAYVMQIHDEKLKVAISDDGTWKRYVAETSEILKPDVWYHVVGTYDGAKIRAYVNGEQRAEYSVVANIHTQMYPLKIGCLGTTSKGNWFNGAIDNVRIFSRALNATEISYSYQHGSPLESADLVLWHKLDSEPIDTANITIGREVSLSSLTSFLSRSIVYFGENVVVSGSIFPAHAGVDVHVLISTDNVTFTGLVDVAADSNGNYSYLWTPSSVGVFHLKASWDGDLDHAGAESSVQTMTVVRPSTITSLVSPLKIMETIVVSGSIFPAHAGVDVHVLISTDNVTFTKLVDVAANDDGNYSYLWKPSFTGLLFLKASWDGDLDHAGAESGVQTITVKKLSTVLCSVSPIEIMEGETVYVSGSLSPAKAGVTVTLTYENIRDDGFRMEKRFVATMSDGSFSDVYRPLTPVGSWRVIASWQGDEDIAGARSQPATFTVYPHPSTVQYTSQIVFVVITLVGLVAAGIYATRRGHRIKNSRDTR